ncbi:MAG: CDP-glucose 4,6-dehydratase [Candidatus Baltobacteraceae bacterium]
MTSTGFWVNKRVLVTGHTGFKGSWLSLLLTRLGASVVGVALQPELTPCLFAAARIDESMTSLLHDIRDVGFLASTLSRENIEIVFHLAAQSLVLPSYSDPMETFSVNVLGTAAVLEAARKTPGVRAIVCVTSDKCYENNEWAWPYRESDALGGHDPYSASKACAEIVTAAYRRSFFDVSRSAAAIASARAGNVIGGGDWSQNRLVPDIMRAFASQRPLEIRNLGAVRPWQHVLEPLSGYLLLAEHLSLTPASSTGAWNFGPESSHEKTVGWIVGQAELLWPRTSSSVPIPPERHEAASLTLDSSKARRLLGWRPVLDMEATLKWTVDWYRSFESGADARELCSKDIETFFHAKKHHT